MVPAESYVQVAADGAGKKVRNLSVYAQQPDGTVALVQMQVVALVDERGTLLDLDLSNSLEELVQIGRQQRFLLRMLVNATTDLTVTDADLKKVPAIV